MRKIRERVLWDTHNSQQQNTKFTKLVDWVREDPNLRGGEVKQELGRNLNSSNKDTSPNPKKKECEKGPVAKAKLFPDLKWKGWNTWVRLPKASINIQHKHLQIKSEVFQHRMGENLQEIQKAARNTFYK